MNVYKINAPIDSDCYYMDGMLFTSKAKAIKYANRLAKRELTMEPTSSFVWLKDTTGTLQMWIEEITVID